MTQSMHQILIVEDEPALRQVLRVLLGQEGYKLIEAETAARGEIEARTHKPDLLLVDLPTAFYVTAAQIDGSKIVGQLPQTEGGSTEHFGLLMEKGSTLVGCLNQAVGQLKSSGELAKIQQQWLTSSAGAPVLK